MAHTITTIVEVVDVASKKYRDIADNAKKMGYSISQANKMAADGVRRFTNTTRTEGGRSAKEVTTLTNNWHKNLKSTEKTITGLNERFKMHYLSTMFLGMQIQRTFMGIARTGTDALNKITEGATAQSAAVLGLGAEWEFLQFSIGEAIGEFIKANPWIFEMIEGFADWIQQNREFVGGFIILVAILAGALFIISILKLGVQGLLGAYTDLKDLLPELSKAWKSLNLLYTTDILPTLAKLKLALASTAAQCLIAGIAALLLYLAWENNLFGIKELTYGVFSEVARIIIQMSQGMLNFVSLLLSAQIAMEKFMGVENKEAQTVLADLTAAWQVLEDLKEFSYTPEAKAGVMDYKPLTDAISQILNVNTNVNITTPKDSNYFDYAAISDMIGKTNADAIKSQTSAIGTNW